MENDRSFIQKCEYVQHAIYGVGFAFCLLLLVSRILNSLNICNHYDIHLGLYRLIIFVVVFQSHFSPFSCNGYNLKLNSVLVRLIVFLFTLSSGVVLCLVQGDL